MYVVYTYVQPGIILNDWQMTKTALMPMSMAARSPSFSKRPPWIRPESVLLSWSWSSSESGGALLLSNLEWK